MHADKTIAIVIPCYNEATQITGVVTTLPAYVDKIYVVDDVSTDATVEVTQRLAERDPRVVLIRHAKNAGVGAAIGSGYLRALADGVHITVVMAGDGQMDPKDLTRVIRPVADDLVDYCKGNRFLYDRGLSRIPTVRKYGNFVLSALTKIVTGYWHVSDTQCGYTAISLEALGAIDLKNIYPRYGCPNDILNKLNVAEMRVGEVPVNPLYGVGEASKMRVTRVAFPIILLLLRLMGSRLLQKYVYRTGHPLVFAYFFAALAFALATALGVYIVVVTVMTALIPKVALIAAGVLAIVAVQLTLNAFEMDFEFNRELSVDLRIRRASGATGRA